MSIIDQGYRGRLLPLLLVGFLCISSQAYSATRTWDGGTGSWTVPGNWTEGSVPINGDVVILNSGTALLAIASAELTSYSMGGGVLVFTNWSAKLSATNVNIAAGTLRLPGEFTESQMSNRVWISCSNLFLAAGGTINADASGYASVNGIGQGDYRGGGGYGGRGGIVAEIVYYEGGPTNGSCAAPIDPGSGGGSAAGGAGGGAIRIEATGTVTVNGIISADGGTGGATYSGGGSGGGIYITCNAFASTNGSINARGGNGVGGNKGGGGGGRISIVYNTTAQASVPVPSAILTTAGGTGTLAAKNGYIGTLCFPDNALLTTNITKFTGQWIVPGFTSWVVNDLTVNNVDIRFPSEGFTLVVSNDLLVTGSSGWLGIGGNEHESVQIYPYSGMSSPPTLHIGGNLTITNSGHLYIFGGMTNGSAKSYGALLSVTNDIVIAAGSYMYLYSHHYDGGSPLVVASNVYVNGEISADGRGYSPQSSSASYAWGPGGGKYRGGGSHGGMGGIVGLAQYTEISGTNGVASAPVGAGSGGGGGGGYGGRGGGGIQVQASGTVSVNGMISVNGAGARYTYSGGGAGGSIYITCNTFGGSNGTVRAIGGTASAGGNKGAGGGGRVAIVYNQAAQDALSIPFVTFSAAGGAGDSALKNGWIGSVYFPNTKFLTGNMDKLTGQIMIPGFTNWILSSLTVSNVSIRFPSTSMKIVVSNDVLITGSSCRFSLGGNAHVPILESPYGEMLPGPALHVGGNMILTNGAEFAVYAGMTNAAFTNWGALVSVTNSLIVASDATIFPHSHPTNGAVPIFRMNDFFLDGAINADRAGYGAARGPGAGTYRGGGGYGGAGGWVTGAEGEQGESWGSSNAPVQPGSGGGNSYGGLGGGAVIVHARHDMTLNGTISANGGNGRGQYGGGGSGGAIYLTCSTLRGSAANLSATGGKGTGSNSAGGGGGRISVNRSFDKYGAAYTNDVSGGTGTGGATNYTGIAGEIYAGWIPYPGGTVITVR